MRIYIYFLLPVLWLCGACKKEKVENRLPELPSLNTSGSSIRLFNFFGGSVELRVNNIQLTNDSTGIVNGVAPAGAAWFPDGQWKDATSFTIPNNFLDKTGKARVVVNARRTNNGFPTVTYRINIDTVLQNDPQKPMDYLVLYNGEIRAMPRSLEGPSQPAGFKIRVMNFVGDNDIASLTGPATLTFSDGQVVDPKLQNVAPGQVSPYVELPFGAYQFKVFMNNDHRRQLAGPGGIVRFTCQETGDILFDRDQQALFPRLMTFKPGYNYTVFICPTVRGLPCQSQEIFRIVNNYYVIAESSAPANTTFALAQGANADPSGPVQFKVDGKPLGGALAYKDFTRDFQPVTAGTHLLQAFDAAGKMLAEKSYTFSANDYITIWLYEKAGVPQLVCSSNDMSGSYYDYNYNSPDNNDETNGSLRVKSYNPAWVSRFFNLSANLPYATFTNDLLFFKIPTGNIAFNATVNLGQGAVPETDRSVILAGQISQQGDPMAPPFVNIRLNESSPGPPVVAPGLLRHDIAPLYPSDFIADPSLYTPGYMPLGEPGVFSVALVGDASKDAPAERRAKMIIIKHNK